MGYSLAAKFCSEFMGMMLTIFIGESILANELLPSTKGHGLGYLGVAIGFGLAFGVNIAWFSWISAHLNPAMFFFLAIVGKLEDGWAEFAVGSIADFLGAFCGALLVALFFAPHFGWTLPLPPDVDPSAALVEGPAALDTNAGRLASAFGSASRKPEGVTLQQEIRNLFSTMDSSQRKRYDPSEREKLLEKMEVRHKHRVYFTSVRALQSDPLASSRHSVQVAGILHKHDPALLASENLDDASYHSVQVAALLHTHDKPATDNPKEQDGTNDTPAIIPNETANGKENEENVSFEEDNLSDEQEQEIDMQKQQQEDAYTAALQADAHAKLAIFATRPALYNRPVNFLQEMILTAVLLFGAEMFNLRRETQEQSTGDFLQDPYAHSLWVSLFITALILGLGGPTGLAANPARDLGPRLAHALLPIPGKGPSEWHYGLVVPLWGTFTGAALGAAFFVAMEALYDSASADQSGEV